MGLCCDPTGRRLGRQDRGLCCDPTGNVQGNRTGASAVTPRASSRDLGDRGLCCDPTGQRPGRGDKGPCCDPIGNGQGDGTSGLAVTPQAVATETRQGALCCDHTGSGQGDGTRGVALTPWASGQGPWDRRRSAVTPKASGRGDRTGRGGLTVAMESRAAASPGSSGRTAEPGWATSLLAAAGLTAGAAQDERLRAASLLPLLPEAGPEAPARGGGGGHVPTSPGPPCARPGCVSPRRRARGDPVTCCLITVGISPREGDWQAR
ncbi:uncharacterized protein LOC122478030 [Prionailurus bengalensis]|uniref:uncharacterized protein LOC122478030 n=1 Tax=Prionailurus bengalensis TaxID=37029 RepID=UPI001CA9A2B5|nr:uncharacterized protein LOC122478030 [Prionailurus bengalensis]